MHRGYIKEPGIIIPGPYYAILLSRLLTCFCTLEACFRTFLAVVVIMFAALVAAFLADCGTYAGEFFHEWGVPCCGLFNICTHIRTFTVESDAVGHHLHVFFLQARVKAMVARLHAFMQCIDQLLMLFMRHFKTS